MSRITYATFDLLTHIRHYDIGYAVVSLIFITNAVGFMLAAFFVDALRGRFGRGRIKCHHGLGHKLTSVLS
jgi:hypothetical protein